MKNKEKFILNTLDITMYIIAIGLALYLPWKICDKKAQTFNKYSTTIKIDAFDVMFGEFVITGDMKKQYEK
jgi:hypothetical protein